MAWLAAGRLAQARRAIRRDRIILMPMGLRVVLKNRCDEFRERRRGNRFGQESAAPPLGRLLRGKRRLDGGLKGAPGTGPRRGRSRSATDRIVEAEDGGLREHVSGPEARRMLGFPSILVGRPMWSRPERVAPRRQRNRARKNSGRPGTSPLAAGRTERSSRAAAACRRPTPASASDALISLRKCRRPFGSFHSEACSGNSRCRCSRKSGVIGQFAGKVVRPRSARRDRLQRSPMAATVHLSFSSAYSCRSNYSTQCFLLRS